jgi:hypothetical protein
MQGSEQAAPRNTGRFQPGQSGNPGGKVSNAERRRRAEAKARELAIEYGGYDALSPVDRVLVDQAAMLLMRRPRSAEDIVRVSNSIQRLLSRLSKRQVERKREPAPDLRSYLNSLQPKADVA